MGSLFFEIKDGRLIRGGFFLKYRRPSHQRQLFRIKKKAASSEAAFLSSERKFLIS